MLISSKPINNNKLPGRIKRDGLHPYFDLPNEFRLMVKRGDDVTEYQQIVKSLSYDSETRKLIADVDICIPLSEECLKVESNFLLIPAFGLVDETDMPGKIKSMTITLVSLLIVVQEN